MRKWILALVAALSVGAALAATPATVVFDAENMTCPACGITIRKALEQVPGVTETTVDTRAETVTVTFATSRTDTSRYEERRDGKEGVSKCGSVGSRYLYKKNTKYSKEKQ